MIESFRARMKVELVNRNRWKARIELASAILDYIELVQKARPRQSATGTLTRTEYEIQHRQPQTASA